MVNSLVRPPYGEITTSKASNDFHLTSRTCFVALILLALENCRYSEYRKVETIKNIRNRFIRLNTARTRFSIEIQHSYKQFKHDLPRFDACNYICHLEFVRCVRRVYEQLVGNFRRVSSCRVTFDTVETETWEKFRSASERRWRIRTRIVRESSVKSREKDAAKGTDFVVKANSESVWRSGTVTIEMR